MSIKKMYRVISEKNTSVEDPIEVTQKGIVALTTVSAYLPIPTNIEVPYSVQITPLSASARKAVYGGSVAQGGRTGFYCNFTKYNANSVSTALKYTVAANASTIAGESIAMKSNALYQAVRATVTAATATAGVGASESLWTKVKFFGSNANDTNYLKVMLNSTSYAQSTCRFAYEVKGYNNS